MLERVHRGAGLSLSVVDMLTCDANRCVLYENNGQATWVLAYQFKGWRNFPATLFCYLYFSRQSHLHGLSTALSVA